MRVSQTKEYYVWNGMKQRCSNPKHISFPHYGGRGIKVCERWMKSFSAFMSDMGPRPAGATIERENNDGPYAPWNCKWASREQQQSNKRPRREKLGSRRLYCTNATGFKGVSRKSGKFVAQLNIGGKRKHLGLFETAELASQAYLAAVEMEMSHA